MWNWGYLFLCCKTWPPSTASLHPHQIPQAHFDALWHVGWFYIKATINYSISFSSSSNLWTSKPSFSPPWKILMPQHQQHPQPLVMLIGDHRMHPPLLHPTPITLLAWMKQVLFVDTLSFFCPIAPSSGKATKINATAKVVAKPKWKPPTTAPSLYNGLVCNVLSDLSLLGNQPTPIYNHNITTMNWSNSTSHKAMCHINIQQSADQEEAINVHKEISVKEHISGKVFPLDLFIKEHKSDEILRVICDSFMSRHSSGGC